MSALGRSEGFGGRAARVVHLRVALGQALGFTLSAYALGIGAALVGVLHRGAWTAILTAVGIGTTTSVTVKTCRWYRAEVANPSPSSRTWWQRRGIWLMLLCDVPVLAAVGGLAFVLRAHAS